MTKSSRTIQINGRLISAEFPPYVIAEVSANHNGDLSKAISIVEAAAAAGVDAVKLQTLRPDFITINHDGPGFIVEGGLWHGRKLYDLYVEAQTPWEWHESLFRRAKELGVTMFSSPFDLAAVDFLAKLNSPAYKIASFEVPDLPLIERAARNGRPLIISTGMAGLADVDAAVHAAQRGGAQGLALLHCVSSYPAQPEDANLRTIPHLADAFDVPVGLSDHTLGVAVAVAAVSLGACIIEKHFTLSRSDGGLDSAFSLEPDEMKELVQECRTAWSALGRINYDIEKGEHASTVFRRSLYVIEDIRVGEPFTDTNVRSIRPGYGLAPKFWSDVLGRRARSDLKRGTPLDWSMLV